MKIGIVSHFDAAHRLPGYDGKCARVHGHTYSVEVVVNGPVGEDGFVMDFYHLKEALNAVLEQFDHRDLNEILPNPTAEAIVVHMRRLLEERLDASTVCLVSIKLWEGENKWVMTD